MQSVCQRNDFHLARHDGNCARHPARPAAKYGGRERKSSRDNGCDKIAVSRGNGCDKCAAICGRGISRPSRFQGDFSAHLTRWRLSYATGSAIAYLTCGIGIARGMRRAICSALGVGGMLLPTARSGLAFRAGLTHFQHKGPTGRVYIEGRLARVGVFRRNDAFRQQLSTSASYLHLVLAAHDSVANFHGGGRVELASLLVDIRFAGAWIRLGV